VTRTVTTTRTSETVEYVDGGTVIAGGAAAAGGTGTAAAGPQAGQELTAANDAADGTGSLYTENGTDTDTERVNENETPLAGADNESAGTADAAQADNESAAADTAKTGFVGSTAWRFAMIGAAALVALLIAGIAVQHKKNKAAHATDESHSDRH
jgi:hypothetical protein